MAKERQEPSWVLPEEPKEPSWLDTAGQWAGVATNALAPYLTAAGAGGAVAGPPGAAGGVLALNAGDIGTFLYNVFAPRKYQIPLPSETIRGGYRSIGIGRRPETAGQQVFSDVLEGAGAAYGGAKAFQTLGAQGAPFMRNRMMQYLGQQPGVQAAAGGGGAAAPSVAANYFDVTNPLALTGLSLAGGMVGGKLGTPSAKVPSVSDLAKEASDAYLQAKNAGVRISQPAMTQLSADIDQTLRDTGYTAGSRHSAVNAYRRRIDNLSRGPLSFDQLDALHQDIMADARSATNDRTRMMLTRMGDTVDDLITNLDPSKVIGGDPLTASATTMRARQLWRSKSQLGRLDDAVTAARNRAEQSVTAGNPVPFGQAVRDEFKKIVNSDRFARLDPEVQAAVKDVANGTPTTKALGLIASFAPTNRNAIIRDITAGGLIFGATGQQLGTTALALGGLATAGGMARTASNAMVPGQVQRARVAATTPRPTRAQQRVGAVAPRPGQPGWLLLSPATQQAVIAQERGKTAQQRRDTFEPPWWATGQ